VTGSALADHNSKNGEGWANMPNDVHNTRVETRENDDNEAFRDFVRYGEGSKSVNRFETDEKRRVAAADRKGKTTLASGKRLNRSISSMRGAGTRRGRGRR
jgi:hypothetical protein